MLSVSTTWMLYIVYMGALIAFGVYTWWSEKNKSTRHFYTAGNSISWFVLCMTYIAALMSTWFFFCRTWWLLPGRFYLLPVRAQLYSLVPGFNIFCYE